MSPPKGVTKAITIWKCKKLDEKNVHGFEWCLQCTSGWNFGRKKMEIEFVLLKKFTLCEG